MALKDKAYYDYYYDLIIKLKNVKSFVEEIKQEVINDNTTENLEFIKKSRVKEIIDKATGFNDSQTKPISDKDLKVGESRNSSVSVKDKTDIGEGKTSPLDKMCIDGHRCIDCDDCPEKKLNWSGVCAVNDNRNQCSEENCILFPICKIKKKTGAQN